MRKYFGISIITITITIFSCTINPSQNSKVERETTSVVEKMEINSRIDTASLNSVDSSDKSALFKCIVENAVLDHEYPYEENRNLLDRLFFGRLWVTSKGYDEYEANGKMSIVVIESMENYYTPNYRIVDQGWWSVGADGLYYVKTSKKEYTVKIISMEVSNNKTYYQIIINIHINGRQCQYGITFNNKYAEIPFYMYNYPE